MGSLGAAQPASTSEECTPGEDHGKGCGERWGHLAIEATTYLAFQNAGNVYTGYWYRWETTHGKWWHRYIDSVDHWRWDKWSDDNPFLDDYVGHPVMGSITDFIWLQNDPRGKMLVQSNTAPYWHSRLRALAFTTAYSLQWKLGPIGEASIGHNGDHFYYDKGKLTNETGWVELVTTPVGGFGWTLAEDALDKHVITRLEGMSRNPLLLIAYQLLNPTRATGNFLRFRPPWYRDTRVVKATSFWSDPEPEPDLAGGGAGAMRGTGQREYGWSPYGGVHELGTWWGFSPVSTQLFGDANDAKYMPIDLRYSYLISPHRRWALRYSPEITALAMLDRPVVPPPDRYTARKRIYGSGLSPEGFQLDFLPTHRWQPFISNNGGLIYFLSPPLSDQGSHLLYTVDLGVGVNFFHLRRQAVTLGYRYQHLHDAKLSAPVTGTDANTFYVAISRFRTR